ncbi:methyl-accepting chemotaxis protein [Oceanospirillum beijerinckii]|uniref:methyl-accepting chemotaxis protein n=1 Tax=Oceanospirillum beijerinckii TaxID=64976 RepID=UPI0004278FF0|nr:methyl-accepting chemotaxis protein [Oceanospirillum beijerinckii]
MSIRAKLILFPSLALMALIFLSIFINFNEMYQLTVGRVEKQELPAVLGEVEGKIDHYINKAIIHSQGLAENSYIQHWLMDEEQGNSAQGGGQYSDGYNSLIRYLDSLKTNSESSAVFLVSDQSRKFYNGQGVLKTISPDSDDDSWYFNFIKSAQRYELNIDNDETTGNLTGFINFRIEGQGRLLGVGGIGKSLNELSTVISHYRIGKNGIVYLINRDGLVQVHGNKQYIGLPVTELISGLDAKGLAQLTQGSQTTLTISDQNKGNLVLASTPLASGGWILVSEIPESDLYQDINASILRAVLISVSLALVFIVIMAYTVQKLFKPIDEISNALISIAEGDRDLTQRINYNANDEAGVLAKGFNDFAGKISEVITSANAIGLNLHDRVDATSNQIAQTVHWANDQEKNTHQVATAICQMESSASEVALNAELAVKATENALAGASQGQHVVDEATDTIREMSNNIQLTADTIAQLNQDVEQIATVTDVIQGISEQTNLLALNAAIEAARAGEAGRGFAVVADEVRMLSQKTRQSTEEISGMIDRLQIASTKAVDMIEAGLASTQTGTEKVMIAGDLFRSIIDLVSEMSEKSAQIATATAEQKAMASEITENVVSISELSRQTSSATSSSEQAFVQMQVNIKALSDILQQFKM